MGNGAHLNCGYIWLSRTCLKKTSWSSPGIAAPRQTPLGHEVDPHKMDDDGVILNAGAGPGLQIS